MDKKNWNLHIYTLIYLCYHKIYQLSLKKSKISHLLQLNKEFSKIHFLTHTIPAPFSSILDPRYKKSSTRSIASSPILKASVVLLFTRITKLWFWDDYDSYYIDK